ncbi:MAG: hypothetical protein HY268_17305 [Deltaproteobacteria bacterium]|nr:hypothetical protein [Deltaproteobacteria bacterium]
MLAALVLVAIVTQDQTPLRAAPRESALQQTVLWQGDTLEVRGEQLDYVEVYDHRRERAGYVQTWRVRPYPLDPSSAPELLAVVRFLRDSPGMEALGIGYVALFLKAAPAEAIGAEIFDTLGTMAERLARRASARRNKPGDEVLAAHLEVTAGYGVQIRGFEKEGRVQFCYEGDAFRRVLAFPSTEEQHARAALALTRPECVSPDVGPVQRYELDLWRAEVLDRVAVDRLPGYLGNRIRLRRAGVWASLAFHRTRRGDSPQEAATRALQELAGVNKAELAEDDRTAYTEAAVRVGTSRWAAEGTALALAVQPLDTWRELWIFRKGDVGWTVDVLAPGANGPDLGYLDFAGWVPDGTRMLAAREARTDGKFKRSFEIIRLDTLEVEKQAESPEALTPFYRWQDPEWKRQTLAIR